MPKNVMCWREGTIVFTFTLTTVFASVSITLLFSVCFLLQPSQTWHLTVKTGAHYSVQQSSNLVVAVKSSY